MGRDDSSDGKRSTLLVSLHIDFRIFDPLFRRRERGSGRASVGLGRLALSVAVTS